MQRRRARFRTYPSPSIDSEDDDGSELALATSNRRIKFSVDVRFQSAIQQQDNVEVDNILTSHASQLDLNACNHAGLTALHQAVLNRNIDTVKLLLTSGADSNVRDAHGYSPLHAASACGLRNIASLLVLFGADLLARTNEGESPTDLAKDALTADLLMVETCKQIQNHELMERYGFAFRFIDLCERLSTNCRMLIGKLIQLVRYLYGAYFRATEYQNQNGIATPKRNLSSDKPVADPA